MRHDDPNVNVPLPASAPADAKLWPRNARIVATGWLSPSPPPSSPSVPRSADPGRFDGTALAGSGQHAQLPARDGRRNGGRRIAPGSSAPALSAALLVSGNWCHPAAWSIPLACRGIAECLVGGYRAESASLRTELGFGRIYQHAPDQLDLGDRCRGDRVQDGSRDDVLSEYIIGDESHRLDSG